MTQTSLITGGAGFIGSNLAERLLGSGERVIVLDNLSRPNVRRNVDWLRRRFGSTLELCVGDVRDRTAVRDAVASADHVFHFAAQVAVTTSLTDPREDFEVNALGTLRVLEAIRARSKPPPLFFTSTNKVYGGLGWLGLVESDARYAPSSAEIRAYGVSEEAPLDFHTPYGCSKGSADQYVHDYARSYGLDTVVFRMSCIYGPRQFGTEDQGWVAHLMLRALREEEITIYGDGHQVRDLLHVADLVDAFLAARAALQACSGKVFNIGGGPGNSVSVLEVLRRSAELVGAEPRLEFAPWRQGDQQYFVADTRKFQSLTGWRPRVAVAEGLLSLRAWLRDVAALPLGSAERVAS